MLQRIGVIGTWWLTCAGFACGSNAPETVEPAPADDEPAVSDPLPADGSGAGLAGGPASGRVDRSVFVVDDVVEGELVQPEGSPAPPPDAGLPEALTRAEQLFEEANIAEAARLYEQVTAVPDNGLAAYAQYKLAWCRFNLQEFQAALEALVNLRTRLAAPATVQERALRREAARDLPMFYAPIGLPREARPFFERILDPEEVVPALQRLGDQYWSEGRENDAAVIRDELCGLRPDRCVPGR